MPGGTKTPAKGRLFIDPRTQFHGRGKWFAGGHGIDKKTARTCASA